MSSASLIPLLFPLANLIGMYYLSNSCKLVCKNKRAKIMKIIVFMLYIMLLFAALFFNKDLINISREILYRYMPTMAIWLLLTMVYFVIPILVAVATIHQSNTCYDDCNKYGYHSVVFMAYFSLVYLLLNIRVTQNWQVVDSKICSQF